MYCNRGYVRTVPSMTWLVVGQQRPLDVDNFDGISALSDPRITLCISCICSHFCLFRYSRSIVVACFYEKLDATHSTLFNLPSLSLPTLGAENCIASSYEVVFAYTATLVFLWLNVIKHFNYKLLKYLDVEFWEVEILGSRTLGGHISIDKILGRRILRSRILFV